MLLLVPREMHQVPQQERLHHGESSCRGKRREGANPSKRVADVVRGLVFFVLQVAIYGKSFCPSARDAFFLLMRNIIRYRFALLKRHVIQIDLLRLIGFNAFHHRVAVLDKVTDFLLFLGKLLIVGIVGTTAFRFWSSSSSSSGCLQKSSIPARHFNPLTFLFIQQEFSPSSFSPGESKQWRTPLPRSTTTGCPYWSVYLYWTCKWPSCD